MDILGLERRRRSSEGYAVAGEGTNSNVIFQDVGSNDVGSNDVGSNDVGSNDVGIHIDNKI